MSDEKMQVTFHLVGGQSLTFLMELQDGATLTQDDISGFAEQLKDTTRMHLSQGRDWAFAIPDMKNVAMVEVKPAA